MINKSVEKMEQTKVLETGVFLRKKMEECMRGALKSPEFRKSKEAQSDFIETCSRYSMNYANRTIEKLYARSREINPGPAPTIYKPNDICLLPDDLIVERLTESTHCNYGGEFPPIYKSLVTSEKTYSEAIADIITG